MIVSLIAAQSSNRVIGMNNALPWDIPEDMNYFKEKTRGKIIIMGRKTFESLPKLLPKRLHIVISRNTKNQTQEGLIWVNSLSVALEEAKKHIPPWPEEVFVIGGGEIYSQALPFTDRIYLTQIHQNFAGDAYFPEFDRSIFKLLTKVTNQSNSPKNPGLNFDFLLFEKSS